MPYETRVCSQCQQCFIKLSRHIRPRQQTFFCTRLCYARYHNAHAPCAAPECLRKKAKGRRGYCLTHYTRWLRHGDPLFHKVALPGAGGIDTLGYHVISIQGRRMRAHRYVMEQALGRVLTSHEIVHHLDGNKLNNALENLCLTTRAQHPKEHATFRSADVKECSRCGKILAREHFYKSTKANESNHYDTHHSQCKACELAAINARNAARKLMGISRRRPASAQTHPFPLQYKVN